MASFTMEMLLKRHGLEHRAKDTPFINLLVHKLRLLGWKQRRFKKGNKWWNIWSDTEYGSDYWVEHHALEDEVLATRVTQDPPEGSIETKNGWMD